MAEPKLVKLSNITRGDTPRLVFPLKTNGAPLDLSGWSARITITSSELPSSLSGALISYEPMQVDTTLGELSYQLTDVQTKQLNPELTYYGDVEISREPTTTNTFTPLKFTFEVEPDFGVAP